MDILPAKSCGRGRWPAMAYIPSTGPETILIEHLSARVTTGMLRVSLTMGQGITMGIGGALSRGLFLK